MAFNCFSYHIYRLVAAQENGPNHKDRQTLERRGRHGAQTPEPALPAARPLVFPLQRASGPSRVGRRGRVSTQSPATVSC